jgi:hypothetical protein
MRVASDSPILYGFESPLWPDQLAHEQQYLYLHEAGEVQPLNISEAGPNLDNPACIASNTIPLPWAIVVPAKRRQAF